MKSLLGQVLKILKSVLDLGKLPLRRCLLALLLAGFGTCFRPAAGFASVTASTAAASGGVLATTTARRSASIFRLNACTIML